MLFNMTFDPSDRRDAITNIKNTAMECCELLKAGAECPMDVLVVEMGTAYDMYKRQPFDELQQYMDVIQERLNAIQRP